MKLSYFGFLFIFLALTVLAEEEVRTIDSRRELLVDSFLLGTLENVTLVPGTPVHRETVLTFNKPWEGRYCGYVTVLKDGDLYRMYYRGLPEAGRDGSSTEVTCCAESKDGVVWYKPELGLFKYQESSANNIVLADHAPYSHNFSPFLNTRPGARPKERYLAIAGTSETGLSVFASPDGFRWNMLHEGVILEGAFDSQNVAFWSDTEQCYVCYFRTWSEGGFGGYRWISRSTSQDAEHWSAPEVMQAGNAPPEHIYTNQTTPYFGAPHIYISLAARFMPGRRVVDEATARSLGIEGGYFNDCSDNVLMTSRGGARYDRTFMEGFVRPEIGLENWTSRTNYPAWGIVPVSENELSFYIQHNYGQPTARLDRYTLRMDGFAGIRAPYAGGRFTTRTLIFSGNALFLNFSTSAAGSIRVSILDDAGSCIPGYELEKCHEIIGNMINYNVSWTNQTDLGALAGKPVRLLFEMKDADIYALQFQKK